MTFSGPFGSPKSPMRRPFPLDAIIVWPEFQKISLKDILMSSPATQILSVDFEPLNIPLIEPFVIAIGRLDEVRNVLITVTLENGVIGYGEAAPLEPINGENQATVLAT